MHPLRQWGEERPNRRLAWFALKIQLSLDELASYLARKLGRMTAEAEQAYEEGLSSSSQPTVRQKKEAELLTEIANKLGIDTAGKTKEQLVSEIVKKVSR